MQRVKSYATLGAAAAAGAAADDTEPFRLKNVSVYAGVSTVEESYSPLDFDRFIPWVCKQWCASTAVIITRKTQEQYLKYGARRVTTSKNKLNLRPKVGASLEESMSCISKHSSKGLLKTGENAIPITAYYDTKQRLVEISIVGSEATVSKEIINAFSLSIPYHSTLTRFTFRRSGLTCQLIYEINKLLPISNISEICFDDSYVRQGNYYILLEQSSKLKYLSLNRCNINDEVCIKIFTKLIHGYASNILQVLELESNNITDIGATFIASVLRVNRSLLHLNLSGNQITDRGFIPILYGLMEFRLNDEEDLAMRRRKLSYLQNKMAVYARCLDELKYGKVDDTDSSNSGRRMIMKSLRRKSKKIISEQSVQDVAEMMARGIVGEFHDPFSPANVVYTNELIYSKGNFVLCSINMAYNHLEYPSVKKLYEVLKYQDETNKSPHTGLIRVTIEGNYIPKTCTELDDIGYYLKKVVILKMGHRKTRTSSAIRGLYGAKLSPTST